MSTLREEDLRACARLARNHYENFAVASLLLPRNLRLSLAAWEHGLQAAAEGRSAPHFAQRACGTVIHERGLPLDLFRALFRAFRRDTVQIWSEAWSSCGSWTPKSSSTRRPTGFAESRQ